MVLFHSKHKCCAYKCCAFSATSHAESRWQASLGFSDTRTLEGKRGVTARHAAWHSNVTVANSSHSKRALRTRRRVPSGFTAQLQHV